MRILFVISLFLISCSSQQTEFESVEELQEYLNDPENGHIISEKSSELNFEAKLIPAFEGEKNPRFTVQLRISRKDGGSVIEFGGVDQQKISMREQYLSFDLLKDVTTKINGKTVPAAFHHYERNYGLKPSIDVLFEFPHTTPTEDVNFYYRDELFGQGRIKLKFNKELFNKCYVAK